MSENKTLDLPEAKAEARLVQDNLSKARQLVETVIKQSPQLEQHRGLLLGDTALLEISNQLTDQFKAQRPELYQARMNLKDAQNDLEGYLQDEADANRVTESFGEQVRKIVEEGGSKRTRAGLVGEAVGRVSDVHNLGVEGQTLLFRMGLIAIPQDQNFDVHGITIDINAAARKQEKFIAGTNLRSSGPQNSR